MFVHRFTIVGVPHFFRQIRNPEKATVNVNTPAMTDVAITDLVSRYTQKVTANHTKLLVIKATSEFAKVT